MKALSFVSCINFIILFLNCNFSYATTPCSEVESVNITGAIVQNNGSIYFDGVLYETGTWYENEIDGITTLYGCPCLFLTCLWKCCSGRNQAYFGSSCNETDMDIVNPFSPPLYNGSQLLTTQSHRHFHYMYNRLCSGRYRIDPATVTNEEFFIQPNGTLYEISNGYKQWLLNNEYCVDYLVDNTTEDPRLIALVCFPDEIIDEDSPALYITYGIGLLVSVPFLLATLFVYAFIPELRNVHGMCLMAYCGGLIVAYTFLAFLKLNVGSIAVSKDVCLAIAFIIYYAFQTSFFWLNVMCYDIWRTFSGYRGGSSHKRRECRKFTLYGLYAWGVPVILTGFTVLMQFGDFSSDIITPGLGHMKCWFSEWKSELLYFFTPVLCLVVVNVVLFIVTAYRIRSIRQETAILKGAESARSDRLKKDKQRYALYLKLFVVMGVNWVVELISFAAGGSNWYWIVTDLSNIALGLFIFIIFVWKNKVRNLIRKRIRGTPGITSASDSNTGRWVTRSSSAPTEDTRVSSDDAAIRLNPH